MRVSPVSQIRSMFPILNNPAKRHLGAGLTPGQFHYARPTATSKPAPTATASPDDYGGRGG